MCAGDEVMMELTGQDQEMTYKMSVDVITRITKPAPASNRHYSILLHRHGKCAEAKKVKIGSMVTMNTITRIPMCKYFYRSSPL